MKTTLLIVLCMIMSICLFAQGQEYKVIDTQSGKALSLDKLANSLQKYDVIFFGEFHDDATLHQIEAEILPLLAKQKGKLAVSMEMFERDNQEALDKYLKGDYTNEEFGKNARLWPNYETDYKPIIDYAKLHSLHVIAANIPRRYATMVSRNGITCLDTLSAHDKAWIAKKPVVLDDAYKEKFLSTMQGTMAGPNGMPGKNNLMDNMYAAQCIKDDTMAESIHNYLVQNPGTRIIHYNGDFHSAEHLGTAQKLALMDPKLKIAVITPDAFQTGEELVYQKDMKGLGDYVILIHRSPEQDSNKNSEPEVKASSPEKEPLISHDISIELYPENHMLRGKDTISFIKKISPQDTLLLSPYMKITSIKNGKKKLKYILGKNNEGYQTIHLKKNLKTNRLTVIYEGTLYNYQSMENGSSQWGIISDSQKEGIYLPLGNWYPTTGHGLMNYTVSAICKSPVKLVCSGKEEIQVSNDNYYHYTWKSEYPYEGVSLFGGNYTIKSLKVDDTRLSVYFLTSDPSKSTRILSQMQSYYEDYTSLFGKYPGSSLNLIENFLPEGMSYPDMYIFPSDLFRSTDIMISSTVLGHEICRTWWGNSVYAMPDSGNWSDILNNFIANYYYLEMHGQKGDTDKWRRNALQDINYLPEKYQYPIKDFYFAEKKNDAVIGFQKGSMMLYDIYNRLGKDTFFGDLRNFHQNNIGYYVNWDEILSAFTNSQAHIQDVAHQWLNRTDIPILAMEDVKLTGNKLNFNLKQSSSPFILRVPIAITYQDGADTVYVETEKASMRVELNLKGKVKSVEIDPGYKVIRRLQSKDMPFCLKRTLQENPLIITPESGSKYGEINSLTTILSQNGFSFDVIPANKLDTIEWKNRSLLVFGSMLTSAFLNKIHNELPNGFSLQPGSFEVPSKTLSNANSSLILSYSSPFNSNCSLSFWCWNSETAVKSLRNMFKYVEHSWQAFDDADQSSPLLQGEIIQKDAFYMRWEIK
ncbi:MAG TPA: ChaN family lipoprotein [Candidatus Cloacimonadota bacterium]|nr:ChaN family lipoprotein [Candidatus Cloacimonadota bacterium]HPT72236.1 ChaN family lipoprotein [Candidatus Cloacimonadota bacterium]